MHLNILINSPRNQFPTGPFVKNATEISFRISLGLVTATEAFPQLLPKLPDPGDRGPRPLEIDNGPCAELTFSLRPTPGRLTLRPHLGMELPKSLKHLCTKVVEEQIWNSSLR